MIGPTPGSTPGPTPGPTQEADAADAGSSAQQERRRRILDATLELASQGGFDAVQMREVAQRAEVALGTLYRYFPSKIHLLVSGLERELARAAERLREQPASGDTAGDRVIAVLRTVGEPLRTDQRLTEALTRAYMFADSSASAEIDRVLSTLTGMLVQAIRAPDEATGEATGAAAAEERAAVARVIVDVWLAALVAWVTGRATLPETAAHMARAVHLVLRD